MTPHPDLNGAVARAIGCFRVGENGAEAHLWQSPFYHYPLWTGSEDMTPRTPHRQFDPEHDIADAMRAAAEMRARGHYVEMWLGAEVAGSRLGIEPDEVVPYADTNNDSLAALALAISLAIKQAGEADAV